ncbi:MAG: hypothetical protein ACRCUP_07080 [Mycoplasmatales bacterium]
MIWEKLPEQFTIEDDLKKLSASEFRDMCNEIYSKISAQRSIFEISGCNNIELIANYLAYFESQNSLVINGSSKKKISINKLHNDEINSLGSDYLILKTSGSTGLRKTCGFTKKKIIENAKAHSESINLSNDGIGLICMPIEFGYANTAQLWSYILLGKSIRLTSKKSIINIVDILKNEKITDVTFGGSLVNAEFITKLKKNFAKSEIYQTYGQTEFGPRISTSNIRKNGIYFEKCLKGIKYFFAESGELFVKSPFYCDWVLTGTEVVINKNFIGTGDIFEIKDEKFRFCCRNSEILKFKGFRCSINEIINGVENKFEVNCQAVRILGTVGNDTYILRIVESDELKKKKSESEIIQQIIEYTKNKFSKNFIPLKIVFVSDDQIEYTKSGKKKVIVNEI